MAANKNTTKPGALWEQACLHLREVLSEEACEQWFDPILPLDSNDGEVVLGVSDDFFATWLSDHYGDLLKDALTKAYSREVDIRYETGHVAPARERSSRKKKANVDRQSRKAGDADNKPPGNCHDRYTFKNFVVGPENRFAYAAAMGMVRSTALQAHTNPLFIYGGTGLGKTHLLQAVAHEAFMHNPEVVVEYVTCEDFLNLYVDSLSKNRHSAFRKRFRKVDYLLIDDIQFLAKKKQLQEEFFNTFNTLHNVDKKILLTSDRRPSEIGGLEARLVGRFDSGLTVEITPLGVETRLAILRKKQEEHEMKFDDEILYFIASNISSNVRRLEGALTRLITYCSLSGLEADMRIVSDILSPYLEEEAMTRISMDHIQRRVAEHFDLRLSDMTGSKRPKNIAIPRMIAMYLSRKMTDCSTTEIGSAFGGRNHATVIHACNRIDKERRKEQQMERTLAMLERKLQHR